jgi:peptidoglycan/LPS O-acetylase OafA/YrhL
MTEPRYVVSRALRNQQVRRVLPVTIQGVATTATWLLGNSARTDYKADTLLWGCAAAFAIHSLAGRSLILQALPKFWPGIGACMVVALCFFHPPAYIPLLAVVIPSVVAYTLIYPTRFAGRVLETPILRGVGRLSYSLYLWQQLFLTDRHLFSQQSILQIFPLNVTLTFVFAYLSFRFIECPCIALGGRLLSPRAAKTYHCIAAQAGSVTG